MVVFLDFIELLLFPIITLVLWTFLFNSKNSKLTRFIVQGGYMILVIPILILTFLAVPFMVVAFWMNTTNYSQEIVQLFLGITIALIVVVEYYYVKRIITEIEEKENMSIIDVIKRELNPETKKERQRNKDKRAEESGGYFDEITRMNDEKRRINLEKKEKLKKALLNEFE